MSVNIPNGFNPQTNFTTGSPEGSPPTLSSSRKKRKTPSQIRRSRKRLEDFLQRKARGSSGKPEGKPLDSAKEATVTDQDGDSYDHGDEPATSLDSHGHSDEPVTSLDVDLAQCDSVTYEEREGIPCRSSVYY